MNTLAATELMGNDSTRWDLVHQKIHKEHTQPSRFAVEREKLFRRGSIVCDLGGGSGSDVLHFLKNGHSVILLDISSFALQVAEERARNAKLDQNLVTHMIDFGLHALPLKDNSIDVAYSRISLNYFGHRHTAKILQDIYRSLKIGGSAYLTFKSPADEKEMLRLERSAVVYEEGVYIEAGQLRSRFTIEQLQHILLNAKIPNANVEHYEEELGDSGGAFKQTLYQNEVNFTKVG
ncbi:class I SAM-dependent methyltransferase [Candidatus Woesebacteria bacterium]|nr:MAG: class I SAM-dependent methyltransferase [Candidatus Woesebacteria bacterium]